MYAKKKKKNQARKTKQKITLKQKSCVKYLSKKASKENMAFKWHTLSATTLTEEPRQFTHQDFLWFVAAMRDRYRIQEFGISSLSPSQRKCIGQSYCLTKHPELHQPRGLFQNYIHADACYVANVSLPNYKAFSWESWKETDSTSPMETFASDWACRYIVKSGKNQYHWRMSISTVL